MSEHDVRKIAEAIIDDARKGACGACGSIINESVLAYNIAAALTAERANTDTANAAAVTAYAKVRELEALLDTAKSALAGERVKLERLRKLEESAADRHIEDANLGTPEQASASFAAWVKVRDERMAFEKTIGGGT